MIGLTTDQTAIREAVEKVCEAYDDAYWRDADESGRFPEEFVTDMAAGGWLGVAMPEEVGGAGLGLTEAAIMMQAVTQSGAGYSGASAIHLNIFGPMPLAKFGSAEQRLAHLPRIISGEDRMCFGVTEPNSGLDTASLETRADRIKGGYRISGRKMWTSGAQRANKILITDEELAGVLGLVLVAGLDTVAGILGHVTRFLADHPDLRNELRANPDLIPGAVEEFLRRFVHIQLVRQANLDIEIDGVLMKRGDMIVAPLILHNADDDRFPDPLRVDVRRSRKPPHITFGGPAHRCLGAMLARTELRIFLQEWLTRIPDFEVLPGADLTVSTRLTWNLQDLPLRWDVG